MKLLSKLPILLMSMSVAALGVIPLTVSGQGESNAMSMPQKNTGPGAGTQGAKVEIASGRILVRFKSSAKQPKKPTWGGATQSGIGTAGVATLQKGAEGLSANTVSKLAAMGLKVEKTMAQVDVSSLSTKGDVGKTIQKLLRSGLVEYAEPVYKVKASAFPADPPNDPFYANGSLWGLNHASDNDIDAREGWVKRSSATTAIVGVIDTGVDYTHEDLSVNMWKNPGETAGDGIDNDANGYIDDVYGINTIDGVANPGDPMDDNGHGTHVSGTIGGKGNNGKGVIGVAPSVKIMALKFLDESGGGSTEDAIEAINYALAIKAKYSTNSSYKRMILSNSWGGGGYSNFLYDAINNTKTANMLFIAAAGNDGMDTDMYSTYPAGYDLPNIVSVGSSDVSDNMSYFSNYGCSSVDLIAPGSGIWSTIPVGLDVSDGNADGYASFSGTSMATPHVSGAAALIWAKAATGTEWSDVKAALMNSVEKEAGFAKKAVSQGRLNLNDSLDTDDLTKPAVFSVSPSKVSPSDSVVISGINFGASAGSISLNGNALTVYSWSDSEIQAYAPAAWVTTGWGSLQVTNASGVSSVAGACAKAQVYQSYMNYVGKTILPRGWTASAQVGSTVWVMGGYDSASYTESGLVESVKLGIKPKATIDTDWMMPVAVSNAGAAALGTDIYVVGGIGDKDGNGYTGIVDSVQVFDTLTQTWSEAAPLPMPVAQPAVVAMGNKIVVFGGVGTLASTESLIPALATTYIYDPATDEWTVGASMPTPRAYASAVRLSGSAAGIKAVVAGGSSSPYFGYEMNTVDTYNIATNSWSSLPAMEGTRSGAPEAYVSGKVVMASGVGSAPSSGEVYNSGAWLESLVVPGLYTAAGGSYGGYFYMLTGADTMYGSLSNAVYRVKP